MSGGFRSRSKSGDQPNSEQRGGQQRRGQQRGGQQRGGNQRRGGAPRGSSQRGRGRGTDHQRRSGSFPAAARSAGVDLARAVVFDVLRRVDADDAFANLTLPKALSENKVSGRDAAFATELTYGTLRTEGVLDAVIADCASRGLDAMAPEVLTALRLGTYQVLYTRVEAHAAVDTTVRLVEASGHDKAKGFANGIMRTITRTPAHEWLERLSPQGDLAALAFRHAHPEWIARSFEQALGTDAATELEAALDADSQRPIVHLVARPGEISAEELALITGCEEGRYSPYAVYLEHGDPGSLEPVRQGLAAVQDEGSQLIARAVTEAPVEGDDSGRWLDLCAGPGGKAALMGAIARIEDAHVDAVEVSQHRARLIEKTVRDLPVTVHTADGRRPGLEPGFDRVLVDAPCSGLGALRRRPEARWRKSEGDITDLTALQAELLDSALNLVRPGGVVVYSTCSPDLRETRGIVEAALSAHGDGAEFQIEELNARDFLPDMGNVGHELSAQLWPHRHGTDAMFFAVLRRSVKGD
ncbi:transcription antitermination factor NusB [uncultured Corynebacterium sp.]|uniref:RsmB/NOP family class I SAM-dependent RNA methyltransferase n=1 Tax=Corynebacterium sp. YSMAA5_1_F9 TaxID=3383591 RepID=UPI0025FA774D|nr:transcription antitermination factor NusB [uncultured Corynebacterium sp.]